MNTSNPHIIVPRPREIVAYLDEHVVGQYAAKRTLAASVFNHYKRVLINKYGAGDTSDESLAEVTVDKSNILMAGHTGTGKTYMVKMISKAIGIPCYVADSTKITESGYVGDDVESILVGLLQQCGYNIDLAEMGIVVLDEIDKIGRKSDNPSITRDVGGEGVQQGLLKIVEGSVVGVPPNGGRKHPEQPLVYVDTTDILFIGMGAFDGLDNIIERRMNRKSVGYNRSDTSGCDGNPLSHVTPDDLKKFGMIPELIGRFPVMTYTDSLTEEDMYRILTVPKNNIISQYRKLFSVDNINLTFTDEAIRNVASATMRLGIGARGIRGVMEKIMSDVTFDTEPGSDFTVDAKYVSERIEKMAPMLTKAA